MLCLNSFLVEIFWNKFNFYFPFCQIHYHSLKQRKIKIELIKKIKPENNLNI